MRFLGDLADLKKIALHLQRRGLSKDASLRAAAMFGRVSLALREAGQPLTVPIRACWVPGRIELLGKHTDYAGGSSLLVAVERGFCIVAVRIREGRITFIDAANLERVVMNGRGEVLGQQPGWSVYPVAALRRIADNFGEIIDGGLIAFESNLPAAAGMSSSSAFIIATCMALHLISGYRDSPVYESAISSPLEFADYMGHVENGQTYEQLKGDRGVGTFGGSEDHTAILCAKARRILHAAFKPTRILEYVDLPRNLTFCIGSSGVTAEKTGAAQARYNAAAIHARRVLDIWNGVGAGVVHSLGALIQSPEFEKEVFLLHLSETSDALRERFEQFYNETENYIPAALKALAASDLSGLGNAVSASQADAERYLGNQIAETIHLARSARNLGAIAASSFGAGFGGAVWALLERSKAEEFLMAWQEDYARYYPQNAEAQFFADATGPAAFEL